jgi:imidazolonepropionase-like amidohydrolase
VALRCWGRTVDEMALRAPSGMKSGARREPEARLRRPQTDPQTRLGTAAVIRSAFTEARNYLDKRANREEGKPFERDLRLEALGLVLEREIPWRQHCHRADDIATAMRIAAEFGYRWSSTTAPRPT